LEPLVVNVIELVVDVVEGSGALEFPGGGLDDDGSAVAVFVVDEFSPDAVAAMPDVVVDGVDIVEPGTD
jgi:8-oxo-dGTP pyrophosphatase MutT (NUDIX family)